VLATQMIDVAASGGSATFKADPAWGPGAYATAILYRPMDSAAKRMPRRAVHCVGLGLGPRHGGERDGRRFRRRSRHPEYHAVQDARAGLLFLRSAPPRPRDARPLRQAH